MDLVHILHDVLRMLRRRAVLIALISVPGVIMATFIAFVLPPKYQTTARILVESQQIPDDLARSTVTSTAFERIKLIEQRMLARDSLRILIDDLGLYSNRPDMLLSDRVAALREAISIRPISLGQTNRRSAVAVAAFDIAVVFSSPRQAVAIANRLVEDVLSQNIRTRQERAEQTLAFFEQQREQLARELSQIEAEITAFKTENEAALPESLQYRRNELSRLQEADQRIERDIAALRSQQVELQDAMMFGGITPATPEDRLLRELEIQLAQKQAVLADTHPEIRALQARIASLRSVGAAGAEVVAGSDDPTRSVAERAMERQMEMIASQTELLAEQRRANAVRSAAIEETLQRTPTIEAVLTDLTRRRDELLRQYQDALERRTEAAVGQRLEDTRQAERLEIIEQAVAPTEPISPNRKKLLFLGVAGALAGSFGLAFLLELLNPAIRTSRQMLNQLGVAPMVAIPYVRTRAESFRRRAMIYSSFLFVTVAIPASLWAVDQHVRPLQIIAERLYDRSGLDEIMINVRTRF